MESSGMCLVIRHGSTVVCCTIINTSSSSHYVALYIWLGLSACTSPRLNRPLSPISWGAWSALNKWSLVVSSLRAAIVSDVVRNTNGSWCIHNFFIIWVADRSATCSWVKGIITIYKGVILLGRSCGHCVWNRVAIRTYSLINATSSCCVCLGSTIGTWLVVTRLFLSADNTDRVWVRVRI